MPAVTGGVAVDPFDEEPPTMADEPQIDVRDVSERSAYVALLDRGEAVAEYRLLPDHQPSTIVFTHTEVPAEMEGRGVGSTLVRFALDDARARDLAVEPQCPFVRSWIERHDDYADLVER